MSAGLRKARASRGLTGLEVAKLAGVIAQAYLQWEAGKTMPRGAESQCIVADALGVTINAQFFDQSEQPALLRSIAVWSNKEELDEERYVFLPAPEVKLSAGDGSVVWHVGENGLRQAFTQK
ncbi:helix-turn-helix transcriptional regulator [Chromobacterium sp. IIBBL 290-4]|uniref:helix-turn-helix transcriptional regulator n=1 Tax=Chromobacterium sp. IIBBL 290-4 TaxID=2953890 RepID=UPI0020B83D35|nr:helix-turn-helix transcriptional regulator [Chromobacterium sp. IIBBL 290-4]UTH73187.1 helix-turn-helix domain-containing protein [Chromobacterium sp. IIBBL 290-4]